jgi:hypothetical protein
MGINPGVGYTGANLGGVYGLSIDQSVDWLTRNVGRQFECSLSGDQVGGQSEYYLQVRKGLVEFDHYVTDDKGIIDIDALGGFNDVNIQNMFLYMNKFNIFPAGKRVTGDNNETSDFISDGYIKLEKEKNYFVFIYKTTPDWQPNGNLLEARAPQVGVAEDSSQANLFITTKRNGAGFLQSYLKSGTSATVDNIVTADPLSGKIANFDAAELNQYINFDTDLLDIVRSQGQGANHAGKYPAGMQTWLDSIGGSGQGVPVWAKPSINSDIPADDQSEGNPDEMTINNVPYGQGWTGSEPPIGFTSQDDNEVYYSNLGTNLNSSGLLLALKDVLASFEYDGNSLVSGIIDTSDFTIVPHADAPASDIIYFDNTDIDIVASNPQTSITTVGAMTIEGTGFVVTDCYRQDIAYIKWEATLNRFQIYQLQYGPIKLRQNPLGPFKTKLLTGEEEAEWDAGFDLCEDMTGVISGYTKDLNEGSDVHEPPSYVGEENIGGYQSPKETL